MVAPSKHMDPWSHEQVPLLSSWLHAELNSARKYHGQCSIEGVPASEAIRILKRAPAQGTHYEHWHQTVFPMLLADAQAAWDQRPQAQQGQQQAAAAAAAAGQQPAAVPAMHGEYVIEFYVQQLAEHFKLDRERHFQKRYCGLQQERRAPTHLLADMQQCWPHLRSVQPETFAADFVQKLDPAIRENVQHKLATEPIDTWFGNLQRIANEANVAWDNYRRRQMLFGGLDPTATDGAAGASSSTGATSGSSSTAKAKKFYCSEHGANDTHATSDCHLLRRQQRAALATADSGASSSSAALPGLEGLSQEQIVQVISALASLGEFNAASKLACSALADQQAGKE